MDSQALQAQARVLGSPRWWNQDDPNEAARLLQDVVTSLEVWAYQRRYANLAYARMASGRDLPTVYGLSMSRSASGTGGTALEYLNFRSPTFNLIGSAIETLVNKLGRNRIWVKYLTDGGDYKTRLACSKAEDYVEGLFYAAKVHREMKQCLQDALTWGTAFAKVFSDESGADSKICFERVIPDEILVDEMEAIYGRPRSLYQRRFVHKQQLAEMYLERGAPGDQGAKRRQEIETAIFAAQSAFPGLTGLASQTYNDMIPYVEGWHLGAARRGHVIGIGKIALNPAELQVWNKPGYPFAVLRYNTLGFGFWGQGLAEVLAPHQKKINRLNEVIDEAQRRIAVPRVIVDTGSGITADMLANTIGGIIKKKPGAPSPEFITPPAVPAELYQDREAEIAKGYQRAGISQDAAAGEMSDKDRSGAAERIRDDIKSQRFICTGQALEDFGVDIADLMLGEAVDTKPVVKVGGREPIKWQDVKDALEKSIAKAFPISAFSTAPDERLNQADRMLAAGQLSREDYLRVIDYPDVKGISSNLATAAANNIERTLAQMLEGGPFVAPDKYMDVQLAFSTAHARFEYERSMKTPAEALEPIRIFIDKCEELIAQGNAPAPQAPQSIVAAGANGLEAQSTSAPSAAFAPAPGGAPGATDLPTGLAGAAAANTQQPAAGGPQ
jgi:hypothetical protein